MVIDSDLIDRLEHVRSTDAPIVSAYISVPADPRRSPPRSHKDDLKRYREFVEHKLYDLLL